MGTFSQKNIIFLASNLNIAGGGGRWVLPCTIGAPAPRKFPCSGFYESIFRNIEKFKKIQNNSRNFVSSKLNSHGEGAEVE